MTRTVGVWSWFVIGGCWGALLVYARRCVKRERATDADVLEMSSRRHPANIDRERAA